MPAFQLDYCIMKLTEKHPSICIFLKLLLSSQDQRGPKSCQWTPTISLRPWSMNFLFIQSIQMTQLVRHVCCNGRIVTQKNFQFGLKYARTFSFCISLQRHQTRSSPYLRILYYIVFIVLSQKQSFQIISQCLFENLVFHR